MDKFDGKLDDVRFTPYAWQKLLFFLYKGDTEISGFGVSHDEDDSLIVDFYLVKQTCTSVSIDLDKAGLDQYLNDMIDAGYSPAKCFRHWIHTHPNMSAKPSGTDKKQFAEFMQSYPWMSMIIVSRTLDTYCLVGLTQGPGVEVELTVGVDWRYPCEDIDFNELDAEYKNNVTEEKVLVKTNYKTLPPIQNKYSDGYDLIDWGKRWERLGKYEEDDEEDDEEDYRSLVNNIDNIDDDDMAQCYAEYLDSKPLHELTDEEFEYLQEFTKDE